jgi:hypothetical protein
MNIFSQAEQTLWSMLWRASDCPTAVYRRNETEITVGILPRTPQAAEFAFEDFKLYKTSRVFRVYQPDLAVLGKPKEKDLIQYNNTVYEVTKTTSGPAWQNVGSYGVMIDVFGVCYR